MAKGIACDANRVAKRTRKAFKQEKPGRKAAGAAQLWVDDQGVDRSAETLSYLEQNSISYDPANTVDSLPPFLSIDMLDVGPGIESALAAFDRPTPIQAASWPVLLAGRDVVGIAKTGSGKTLAYGVPALTHVSRLGGLSIIGQTRKDPPIHATSALVVAPTRELAMQIHSVLAAIGAVHNPPLPCACLVGGVPKVSRVDAPVVVGTPGRLLDLVEDAILDLHQVTFLVLDEADRLLDAGFEPDIRKLAGHCSRNRQTVMFCATWPTRVRRLAADFMRTETIIRIIVGTDNLSANAAISQTVAVLADWQKDAKLLETLRLFGKGSSAIVFCLYKKEAARVHRLLNEQRYSAVCLQGDMPQPARTAALNTFRSGISRVLVATDVACRGLDVPLVELVVNYTFPLTIEDYVHRIGRTGRAGRIGRSITFFTADDKAHAGELQRVLREAGQEVPHELKAFGNTIRKQNHSIYGAFSSHPAPIILCVEDTTGAFFRDDVHQAAKKIRFE